MTNKCVTAGGLTGKERTRMYGEALNEALELFPGLISAVPYLEGAYQHVVVEPLFANRKDGWFDCDPVLHKRYWQNARDTHKGVM